MTPISEAIGMAAGASAVLTFVGTRLWDTYRMEKKFRTVEEAKKCMTQREAAEKSIIKVLRRMEKRMALGNIVMRALVEHNPDVPDDLIQKIESDLGITLGDRNFGIPEV